MNTDYKTCNGTPFNFHPEYNTAKKQNQVPWAALEGGVLMQQEIGHFEPCSSLTNSLPYSASPGGQTFSDPSTAQTCVGGFEGAGKVGAGPCSLSTGLCQNATTEGGGACSTNNAASGALCEFSDMTCVPAGPRPVNFNGTVVKLSWPISGCQDNFFQNGDLDFDGSSYIRDWPDGSPSHPRSFAYIGPFSNGKSYPKIQFETDVAGSRMTATSRPGRAAPRRPGERSSTRSGRWATVAVSSACGTSATSTPGTPGGRSAVTLSTAGRTWPGTAGRSPVPSSPTRRPRAAAGPG